MGPPVVTESCYQPIHAWGWPSGWLTVSSNPDHSVWSAVPQQSRVCWDLPLDVLLVELIASCSDVVWSWPLGVLVLGPLWRDSGAVQCEMLPVTGPGKCVWSYRGIHILWLPLLGLGMCRKDQAAHQGWLLPAPGPGEGQQKSLGPRRSASVSTCQQLLQWRRYELDANILSEYRCDQIDEHINFVGSCNVLPMYPKPFRPIIVSFTSVTCLTDSILIPPQSDVPDPLLNLNLFWIILLVKKNHLFWNCIKLPQSMQYCGREKKLLS